MPDAVKFKKILNDPVLTYRGVYCCDDQQLILLLARTNSVWRLSLDSYSQNADAGASNDLTKVNFTDFPLPPCCPKADIAISSNDTSCPDNKGNCGLSGSGDPKCMIAIYLGNENLVPDDDIAVSLNGTALHTVPETMSGCTPHPRCVGTLILPAAVSPKRIGIRGASGIAGSTCAGRDVSITTAYNAALDDVKGSNTVNLRSASSQGCGNFGVFRVYRVTLDSGGNIVLTAIVDSAYSAIASLDQNFDFDVPCDGTDPPPPPTPTCCSDFNAIGGVGPAGVVHVSLPMNPGNGSCNDCFHRISGSLFLVQTSPYCLFTRQTGGDRLQVCGDVAQPYVAIAAFRTGPQYTIAIRYWIEDAQQRIVVEYGEQFSDTVPINCAGTRTLRFKSAGTQCRSWPATATYLGNA